MQKKSTHIISVVHSRVVVLAESRQPARDIDGAHMLCHLADCDWVRSSKCQLSRTICAMFEKEIPKLECRVVSHAWQNYGAA